MTEDPRQSRLRRKRIRVAGQSARPARAREGTPGAAGLEQHIIAPVEAPLPDRTKATVSEQPEELHEASDWAAGRFDEPFPADGGLEEDAAPAPGSETGPAASTPSVDLRRLLLPVALSAVVAALAIVVAVLAVKLSAAEQAQKARLPALSAAEGAVAALLSVNYQRLSADVAKANSYLTPAFRTSYDKFRTSFAPVYRKYHTVIAPAVAAGALRNVTAHSAVALLFVDQVTTGTNRSSPRVDQSRVRVTLVLRGDRWLVSSLVAL